MTMLRVTTEFTCKVCGEKISFDPNDDSTYEAKTGHEDFFGFQLTTYRVMHIRNEEKHYNSVVVDSDGLFRAYRDAYIEPLDIVDIAAGGDYWIFHEDSAEERSVTGTHLAILINRKKRWVIDIDYLEGVNVTELTTLIVDRVEEACRVYSVPPQPMEMRLANLDLLVWWSENKIMSIDSELGKSRASIDAVIHQVVSEEDGNVVPRRRVLALLLKIIEDDPEIPSEILSTILTSDMLYTPLKTPYEERISDIVKLTKSKIPIAEEILGPLLRGYSTLLEILEKYSERYQEVFDLINFINRRRILG